MNNPHADVVDLWFVAAGEFHGSESLLSAEEARRADLFRRRRDRERFVTFRTALRRLLGERLDIAPEAVAIGSDARGKPRLASLPAARALHFNLSHSEDACVIALSRRGPLGVDIERVRAFPRADALARRVLSEDEQARLAAFGTEDQPLALLRAWTRKEAYLKATGEGLARPLHEVEVSLCEAPRLRRVAGVRDAAAHWSMSAFQFSPDLIGALVAAGSTPPTLRLRVWDSAGPAGDVHAVSSDR